MQQVRSQSVRYVEHRGRYYARFGQFKNNIHPRFRLQLSLDHIIVAFQLGLHTRIGQENLFFPFQNLQSQVGSAQVARHAQQVIGLSGVAVYHFVFGYLPEHAHRNQQARARG